MSQTRTNRAEVHMVTTNQTVRVIGPRYYRTFASHHIPFRPVDEKAYAETEGLAAYYVAYHDGHGRVIRFTKIQLVRPNRESIEVPLAGAFVPGTLVYFAVSSGAVGTIGERIEYASTEDRVDYLSGAVGPDGRSAAVARFVKQSVFTDVYAYWHEKKLRERKTIVPGRSTVYEHYDPDGTSSNERRLMGYAAWAERGRTELDQNHADTARREFTQALRAAEGEENLTGVAEALTYLARVDLSQVNGKPPLERERLVIGAVASAEQAIPIWQALADPVEEVRCWFVSADAERSLALWARDDGNAAEAERRFRRARRCYDNIIRLAEQGGSKGEVAAATNALRALTEEWQKG